MNQTSRAAALIHGLGRFEERHWQRMEEALAVLPEDEQDVSAALRVLPRPPARQVIQSGYVAR